MSFDTTNFFTRFLRRYPSSISYSWMQVKMNIFNHSSILEKPRRKKEIKCVKKEWGQKLNCTVSLTLVLKLNCRCLMSVKCSVFGGQASSKRRFVFFQNFRIDARGNVLKKRSRSLHHEEIWGAVITPFNDPRVPSAHPYPFSYHAMIIVLLLCGPPGCVTAASASKSVTLLSKIYLSTFQAFEA